MANVQTYRHLGLSPRYFSWAREVFYSMWGTFLMILTSQISIPLEPVPITLQTCGVMLLGITLERRAALMAIASYLALGALGAPVFAHFSGGFHVLAGPTGGYLMGFFASVAVMSTLHRFLDHRNFRHILFNVLVGTLVILCMGVLWLSRFVGLEAAISGGFLPFIVPGFVKAVLVGGVVRYLKRV